MSLCRWSNNSIWRTLAAAKRKRVGQKLVSVWQKRGVANYCNGTRKSPKTMILDTPEFKALFTPEFNALAAIFQKHGHELRIAGGAVRDLLMNKQPHDIDFASTATPDQMKSMFNAEGIRMLNNKGEKHGTITARINDKENFEVTTLRIDVQTDGRHAEVQFTTDWYLDANRRDLTVNSLFLGLDGTVYDYFDGIEDLKKKRVTFVGDASQRIREDYLRILRYFRFYGRIADEPDKHDAITLLAIEENVSGLAGISGERIWVELKQILVGNYAEHLILQMLRVGIAPYIGLPSDPDVDNFKAFFKRAEPFEPQAIPMLVSFLKSEEQMLQLHGRLKLSAYERDLGRFLLEHREKEPHAVPLRPYQLLFLNTKSNQRWVREWIYEVFKYRGEGELLEEFKNWTPPKFPVDGNMLKTKGVKSGRSFSLVLSKLKELWVDSDFSLTEEQLLAHVESVVKELDIKT